MKGGYLFHVVFFEDMGWWVAQCLERNLVAALSLTSDSPPVTYGDLVKKLEAVLRVQMEADQEAGIEPFSALPQAPRRFWKMFQSAKPWDPREMEAGLPVNTPVWTELAVA